MMPKRKSYDDKFRASAVVMLEAAGYPTEKGALQKVADNLGVPAMTISRWFKKSNNPAPNDLVNEKAIDLLEAIRHELGAVFGEMPNAREFASYKDLATAAGILIDKLQLLENKPTERVEHSGTITHEERANRILGILESARSGPDRRRTDD